MVVAVASVARMDANVVQSANVSHQRTAETLSAPRAPPASVALTANALQTRIVKTAAKSPVPTDSSGLEPLLLSSLLELLLSS